MVDDVVPALKKRLAGVKVGDPAIEGVRMDRSPAARSVARWRRTPSVLRSATELLYGGPDSLDVVGADPERGAFFPATMLYLDDPFGRTEPHDIEAFGPVNTVMPYRTVEEAIELCAAGKGKSRRLAVHGARRGGPARWRSERPRTTGGSCS
jgi:oxepin-CoA hydrolase/3-oxo-5,6-dehydrosuberyl-CoA semialdehyde dehydrogenase